jgi:ATP-binding cassette, subfamily C (CFTR/MRP), member 10
MKFFDLTPAGRLLNRFSSDTYTIDDSLPFIMNILLAQVFGVIGEYNSNLRIYFLTKIYLGSILVTVYGLPWVCLIIVPLMPIYHWLQHRYRITSRELKRLSSVTMSPIYSHFNDTLEGATVIRAFGRCNQWSQNGEHYVDRCQRATLSSAAAAQWLSLRLQLMGSAILTGGAVVAVAQRNFDMVNAGE